MTVDAGSLKVMSVGDVHGEFFVPSYQRGYRWTEHEVRTLLDDIRESSGRTYYLQPLVVKSRDDDSWELVDGQQRLTTLYLIFRYIRDNHMPSVVPGYSITYETRQGSKDYLEGRSDADPGNNIDFFHMARAYDCIEAWFDQWGHRTTHEAVRLHGDLYDHVKVLWYVAPPEADSRDMFTRLNVGRIPLTDAELVKALLLSRGAVGPGNTNPSLEMAAYWDGIERDLRRPEVWAFVTRAAIEEATHISLLLDTLADIELAKVRTDMQKAGGIRGPERPLFQTFETLRTWIADDAQEFWRSLVELHSLVLGWFEDRDLFHKVGYLISVGHTFAELVELSNGKGRSAFDRALDDKIRAHLGLTASGIADLTYGSKRTSDVLLLMNVETIRGMQDSSERYSFRAHAAGTWSLEHIHAQNAEPLNTVPQWRAWLMYHHDALADLPRVHPARRADLMRRIEEVLSTEVTQKSFSTVEEDVTAVFSPADEPLDGEVHAISNLALLGFKENAALNNAVFEVKRREILRLDKAGSYIPVCTRNVFLKYYSPEGSQQLHFWSDADRRAYLQALLDAVGPYLQPGESDQ